MFVFARIENIVGTLWEKEKMLVTFFQQCFNKSGKLSQDTPVLPQVVKLGHAPDKIQV